MTNGRYLLGLALCLAAGAGAAAPAGPDAVQVTALPGGPEERSIHVQVLASSREEIVLAGSTNFLLHVPGADRQGAPGEPMLPFVTVAVTLPEGAEHPRVEWTESGLRRSVEPRACLPAPPADRRGFPPAPAATPRSKTYETDAFYPPERVVAGPVHRLGRTSRMVLHVYPFRWNPVLAETETCTDLGIRVSFAVRKASSTVAARAAPHSGGPPPSGGMLIVCADALHEAMLPFLYWKRQQGIPTDMVRLSETGSTASNVYAFVKQFYQSTGFEFLQLVGDANLLPSLSGEKGWMLGDPADLRYVLLEGDDMYPDAVVARFPAASAAEASNMVWRSITYERNPEAGAPWYGMGLGAASDSSVGAGLYDYSLTAALRELMLGYTYTEVDQLCPTNGINAALISEALNAGKGMVNFIGHGDSVSWSWSGIRGGPQFNLSHVEALTNTNRLPFIIIAGCDAGRYTVSNCLAESFLKAGAVERATGAVAVHASFDEELADPAWVAQEETISQLTSDSLHVVGPLCFSGIVKALDVCTYASPPGTAGEEIAEMMQLFGDGSLLLRTAPPAPMTVMHATELPAWRGDFPVEVAGVTNALCALYDETLHALAGSARTAGNGRCAIAVQGGAWTNLLLTVTAFNRTPYFASVTVVPGEVPGTLLRVR